MGKVRQVIISGCGRGGTNLLLETVRASGCFSFSKSVEERSIIKSKTIPLCYGTKLSTENIGFDYSFMDDMMDKYKNLIFLFSIRHPIDICMSKIVRGQPSSVGGDGENRLSPDATVNGAIDAVIYMYDIYKKIKSRYPDRIFYIKMEDLILNTENTCKLICDKLNITYNPNMLNFYKNNRNKYHQKRYGYQLDLSQVYLFENWQSAYDGFFINKKNELDQIKSDTIGFSNYFGYKNK